MMASVLSTSRSLWLRQVFSLLLALMALAATPANADRAFSQRYSANMNGDMVLIGNVQLSCTTGAANCATARAGGAYNNNDFTMAYVDIDSDASTFNSTSANLNMPAGSTVAFAALYWAGQSTNINRGQVLLKTPTSFGYSTVNASVLDTSTNSTYQGFRDITTIVRAAGSGTYTVANLQSTVAATNEWGAWSMVVVYQNNSLPLRNFTVFDGLVYVDGVTITLPVSGFLTPLSGPVTTKLGSVNYDGDYDTTGDRLRLNGIDLTDALNPLNNFYNSTIADGGANVTSRNPAYANTLGADIDRVNVPAGILGNGATSATIQITSPSGSEVFWQGVATFMTDLYVPIITPNIVKTGTDLNGGALVGGDTLRWRIYMKNTGLDSGTALSLSDPIPAGLSYKPNSLAITLGANAGAKTDASSDDQAEYIASGTPRVVFRLGSGANGSTGGTLAYNQETEITFDTIVNTGLPSGTPITNTASISYSGQTIPDQFAGSGAAADTVVLVPPLISKSFTPNVIDVGGVSVLKFIVSNPANNPGNVTGAAFLDTYPSGLINAATPNALLNCTAGASGTLVGGSAGGNTIGLAGATIPPNGNCTVTVNVTANAIGNYTNTSAALTTTNAGTGTTASATLSVGKPSISKAFSPAIILAGASSTVSFTLSNLAASPITGVAFSDPLVNMQVAATPAVSNTCGGTVSAVAGSNTIALSGGTIAATGSCTLSVSVTSSSTGDLPNLTTGVSSTQTGSGGNPSNVAYLTVIAPPVLSKSFAPTSVRTNVPSELSLTVSNPNPGTTITGVAFTDTYPANLVNSATASPTLNCTAGSTATRTGGANGGNSIGLSGGSLAPGGSCTVTVNVVGTTTGSKVNTTGTVASSNAGTGAAASATLNITGLTAPTVTKTFGAATMQSGATTTVAIRLANSNAAPNAVTGAAFADTFPSGMVVAATPALSNTCGGTATAVAGGDSLTLTGGTIPAAGNCTVTVTITATDSGLYNNTTGIVTTDNAGTFGPASDTIDVLAPPVLVKSFAPDAIASGGTSVLTIVLTNPTTSATSLTGVAFTDVFPTGMTLANTTTSNTCTTGSTVGTLRDSAGNSISNGDVGIRWTAGILAPNGACTITVNVTSSTVGSHTNTTTPSSTNGGTGVASSAVLTVGRPDITKAFSVTEIASGGTAVLTLTLRNPTATVMSAAAVTDNYPTGLTNSATPAGASTCTAGGATPSVTAVAGGSSVSLSGGGIPANGSCTVTVNVSATGNVINTIPAGALTVSGGGSNGTPATATLLVYLKPIVSKSFADSTITPGTATQLTIGLTNNNSVTASTVAFTDTFPAGMVVAATPATANSCGGTLQGRTGAGAWGAVASGNTEVRLSGGSVLANSSCQVQVNITSNTAGNYSNSTGIVTTGNIGDGDAASASVIVMAPPGVTKTFSPASVLVNETSVLTLTLTNANDAAITGVSFTDSYPSGLVNDATPNAATSCSGGAVSASAGGSSLGLTGASIPANSSCSVTVRVKSAAAGSYANTLAAFTTGNAGTTAAASATLSVSLPMPALVLAKSIAVEWDPINLSGDPKLIPGAYAFYTIQLSNTGPGTPDNNSIIVSDPLPVSVDLYVGNIGGLGTGPVQFTDGSPSSGLSWNYVSPGSMADSIDFSTDGSDWTYVPVEDGQGFDPLVRYIRLKPSGALPAAGGSNPSADFTFRVRLR